MISGGDGALVAAVAALVTGVLVRPMLRALPEPADGDGTPDYRDLGTARFVIGCSVLAGLAAAIAWICLPRQLQPMWGVLAVLGVVLAAVDARTTWLPLRLTRVAWAAMAVATLVTPLLGGDGWTILRAAGGAAVAGALYAVVWFASQGGFGFGDVRYAPLLGAAAAAHTWELLVWTFMLGSVVGGAIGVVRLIRRKKGAFPYAPPMLAGAYAAAFGLWLTG